jgi:hypothetical protein
MKTVIATSYKHLPGLIFTRAGELFMLHQLAGYETRLYSDWTQETFGVIERRVAWKLAGAAGGGPGGGEPIPVANDVQARAA